MSNSQNIKKIKELVTNPSDGIPEELFHFASCITAMVNVDLLIKNKKKPEAFKKYLQKLRGRIKEWSPEETRNIINEMSREFVTKNII